MGGMIPGNPISKVLSVEANGWIQLVLTIPVVFILHGCSLKEHGLLSKRGNSICLAL